MRLDYTIFIFDSISESIIFKSQNINEIEKFIKQKIEGEKYAGKNNR